MNNSRVIEALKDDSLSWAARGVLGYLLTDPSQLVVVTNITEAGPDGRARVQTAVNELIEKGHLVRHDRHRSKGQFVPGGNLGLVAKSAKVRTRNAAAKAVAK
jgi:hypothetical protein